MPAVAYLFPSDRRSKKYTVVVVDDQGRRRTIHFGAAGMSDFTKHRDPARKRAYVRRHARRENWTRSGLRTAGFWARWVLWSKPTIAASVSSLSRRFGVTVRRGRPPRA